MGTIYNKVSGHSLERIAALSDGLFAIAMTLIVLDLHIPARPFVHSEQDLLAALIVLLPQFATYLMTFLTLGIFWTGQQTQLSHFAGSDRHLSWINLAFLAAVATMPFSASLLSTYVTFRLALLLYWLNILVIGAILFASWTYACRHGLVKPDMSVAVVTAIRRRIIVAQFYYALGASLCLINTYWSMGFIAAVQLNYAIAPRSRLLAKFMA
jgi:uncharacterized membrane protein